MYNTICAYTKDTAFQILSSIYALTVHYDGDTSKYYVRYENCKLEGVDGKLMECKGSGSTINDACLNYIALINFATMSFDKGSDSYKLMFMKAH